MDEFEKTIRTTLSDTNKFDAAKAETLRKETVQMFDKKLKKAIIIAWVGIGIGVVFEVAGWIGLVLSMFLGGSVKLVVFFGVIALSGGQFHLFTKLWYWVYHNEIKVRTEVKELQLQVAELAGKEPPSKS
jgi:cation transport ATPase